MVSIWRFNKDNGDVENILNDDDFFGDAVDTPKEGIEQHKKTRILKKCHRQEQGAFVRTKMDTWKGEQG